MPDYFIATAKQTLFLALIITGPPVLVAMTVGLIISILQATTQVQEMTLTFVPKLFGIIITLAIMGPWMLAQLISFANGLLGSFSQYIH